MGWPDFGLLSRLDFSSLTRMEASCLSHGVAGLQLAESIGIQLASDEVTGLLRVAEHVRLSLHVGSYAV